MKYKFEVDEICGSPQITMVFDKPYEMLTNIFMKCVLGYSDKESWLKGIEDTIKGNLENGDFGVQSGFGAEVGKEKTIIYCEFTDEELEISTKEFRRLSEIWFNKLEEFKKIKKYYSVHLLKRVGVFIMHKIKEA